MKKFIATFGVGQVNEGYFVGIECTNYNEAVEFMERKYEGEYCMVYTFEQWIEWTAHARTIGIETEKHLKDFLIL